jgi:hypothetical protein
MSVDRRRFLILGASLVGGLLTLQLGGCGGGPGRRIVVEVAALLPPASAQVGAAWLEASGLSEGELLDTLFNRAAWPDLESGLDPREVARRLATQVADEHRSGHVVEVRSWRLARTEAALAALAARVGAGSS